MFGAALAAESEDLNHGLRQIKSVRNVRRQAFEVDEITFDVLHRFAARANQVMMGFEIAVHQQGGGVRRHLSQKAALNEQAQIVVNGSKRNGWDATPDGRVNVFRRMVSVRSDDGLVDHLALVRDGQAVLRGQFAELLMVKSHNY